MSNIKTLSHIMDKITDPFTPPEIKNDKPLNNQKHIAILEALETHFLKLFGEKDDDLLIDILNAITMGKIHIHHYHTKVYNAKLQMDRKEFYSHESIRNDQEEAKNRSAPES